MENGAICGATENGSRKIDERATIVTPGIVLVIPNQRRRRNRQPFRRSIDRPISHIRENLAKIQSIKLALIFV